MENTIEKNTISKCIFPTLFMRHKEQYLNNPNSKTLYHEQVHETFMYTFFKFIPLNSISNITVNGINGQAKGAIDIDSLQLDRIVDEKHFFEILKYAPVPFVFIPNCRLIELQKFCKGAYYFKIGRKEGLFMDLEFATRVGVGFIGGELLFNENISCFYIGLIYDKVL